MAKDNKINMPLPTLDELFESTKPEDIADEKVVNLQIKDIIPFPNHPFKVNDVALDEMVESIRSSGVNVPITVRKKDNGSYELISGHRRKRACELLGIKEIPCIIRNLTDDEATILMVDSNIQREQVLPSEKAFAYRMKLEALKHQGKRSDIEDNTTSVENQQKLKTSRELLANQSGESEDKIRRYIRLTYLIPELLQKVDDTSLGFTQAVELSYITEENQNLINVSMEYNEISPSVSQAKALRTLDSRGELTEELIEKTLGELKPNQLENQNIKYREIRQYFPKDYTNEEIRNVIQDLLENYYRKWHNKNRDAR